MLSSNSKRHPRRLLLVEFNPYKILVAEISRPKRGSVVVDSSAEFDRKDTDGLRAWIDAGDARRKTWTTVICGLIPTRGVVQRETVQPTRLLEPGYLGSLVQEHQKGRFLTATPFKVISEGGWTFRTVNAVDGTQLPSTGHNQPALVCAMANEEVLDVQKRLLNRRLVRERLEPGLLTLFAALYQTLEKRGDLRAVVVVLILERVTAVYILGKEGVHTPNPVLHGLNSIIEVGHKELGGRDDVDVLAHLQNGTPPLANQATKLVARIGRDLKPVVDSFEMTTGQPVDEIFCAYLPPELAWISESLANATGRTPFNVDCQEWMPSAHLEVAEGGPTFAPHWLGALGLVANLPEVSSQRSRRTTGGNPAYQRPWHVDCSVATDDDDRDVVGRRFLVGAAVASVALLVGGIAAWQVYATYSLRADTTFWQQQMAENQKLFVELKAASVALRKQSTTLDRAHELMAEPFQLTDLLVNLGRTIPPHMKVDRIESNDSRVAISGLLLEPAEEASGTLGRYMDDLRRNKAVGPLFSNIAITTLQRKAANDEVIFELTLRLNRPPP